MTIKLDVYVWSAKIKSYTVKILFLKRIPRAYIKDFLPPSTLSQSTIIVLNEYFKHKLIF